MAYQSSSARRPALHGNISNGSPGRLIGEEWKKWAVVRASIPRLPEGVSTWDIHRNLHRYGKIDFIRINESRQGNFTSGASVTFKPPPRRAPWEYKGGVEFIFKKKEADPVTKVVTEIEQKHTIIVLLERYQTPEALIESPVRPGIKYPAEMTLLGDSIDFGYLVNEDRMAVLASRDDRTPHKHSVRLILNLKRRELALYFPTTLESRGKTASRLYRFFVALDDQFSMCDTFDGKDTSLIIHVRHPPWYSRQLKEAMQLSHDPLSRKWGIDDTWVRQTDVVKHKDMYAIINETPISVRKDGNSIDISRWTTFRFNVKSERADHGRRPNPLQEVLKALKDFNIRVTENPAFGVQNSAQTEASIWNVLHTPLTIRTPGSIYLDFQVRYQLEVCISSGWLNEYLIDMAFLKRLSEMEPRIAKRMLVHIDTLQHRVYNPMDIFDDIRFQRPVKARPLPANCQELLHATVTATGLILHTPSIELTNRIIRMYRQCSDRFLRVRFEDDSYRGQTRLFPATNNKMVLVFERVRRAMRKGIVVAGRHYEFLAWGNSQLREHGAYFFASDPADDITAETIRARMGTFDGEKIVAKRAARMGQCFSTTKPVKTIGGKRQWHKDPTSDIINNNYTFTDGVGRISSAAAEMIQLELKIPGPSPPSAFQFRLGGCKGVLAIDTTLSDVNILIRPSQFKFDSDSDELEIIRVSEYWQSFLNRQLILVLSDLGVVDEVFLHMQEDCITALDQALTDDDAALRSLRENVDPNRMTTSIANLVEAGLRTEPFVMSLLKLYRACTLKYLKEKAKIPISKGAFVLGVADETQSLRGYSQERLAKASTREEMVKALPQIFLQYTDQCTGRLCVVEGVCIVARNPSLHRGDIRVVKAIGECEKLQHLRDVLVMPTDGDRDLPSMCSGGDLDGDDYIVSWDPNLIPPEWNAEPFHYHAPTPVTKDNIKTDDIINFFHDYLQNDYLGRIAHAHLAAADFLDQGIQSQQCLQLVNLHSMAVDYPKTGVPAQMPRDLERDQWPHFMEKKGRHEYRSPKILGKLYDAVERVNFVPKLTDAFDRRILSHKPVPRILDVVKNMKTEYEESMLRIMAQHEICSEFEVWSTFVLNHSKAARDFKFHEEIGRHARTLKETYYEIFCDEAGGREFAHLAPFAVTAYHVTYEEVRQALSKDASKDSSTGSSSSSTCPDDIASSSDSMSQPSPENSESAMSDTPMISFPWVLQDVLCKIAIHTYLEDDLDLMSSEERERHDAKVLEMFDSGETVDWWSFFTLHGLDPILSKQKEEAQESVNFNANGVRKPDTAPCGSRQELWNGHLTENGPDSQGSSSTSIASSRDTGRGKSTIEQDCKKDHATNRSSLELGATTLPDETAQVPFRDPALMTPAEKLRALNIDDEDEDFTF
ncbi:uncharacterized protein A1O9_05929 [Exophiala aquamarina CBS 119918]|uniref:RNA-dependent RNA polymerase n=1 Tax=Exophiala aquamarina CBS 119918 TaxID=1182545 RepID=A0A072PDR3_9EURO|nr:uncharacterized protein A1O9_05929 [Exophiala aquamarina CBS 119918]KEF58006.1 hypothetical protein A1O9_05929 [Exophiala aquamarina CBS 119918]